MINLLWFLVFLATIGAIASIIFKTTAPLTLALPLGLMLFLRMFLFIMGKIVRPALDTGIDITLNGILYTFKNAKFIALSSVALLILIIVATFTMKYIENKNPNN